MKRAKKGQQGFTIVEVMIAVLVLGLILLAWLSLESFTAQTMRKVADFSTAQKVFISIVNDVMSAEKGLPPLNLEASNDLNKTNLTRAQLEAAFNDVAKIPKNKRVSVCYDRRGVLDRDQKFCNYYVSYFKIRVRDNAFAGSDLENVPLARVLIQIRYREQDPTSATVDPDKNIVRTRYLTRLVSNVADF